LIILTALFKNTVFIMRFDYRLNPERNFVVFSFQRPRFDRLELVRIPVDQEVNNAALPILFPDGQQFYLNTDKIFDKYHVRVLAPVGEESLKLVGIAAYTVLGLISTERNADGHLGKSLFEAMEIDHDLKDELARVTAQAEEVPGLEVLAHHAMYYGHTDLARALFEKAGNPRIVEKSAAHALSRCEYPQGHVDRVLPFLPQDREEITFNERLYMTKCLAKRGHVEQAKQLLPFQRLTHNDRKELYAYALLELNQDLMRELNLQGHLDDPEIVRFISSQLGELISGRHLRLNLMEILGLDEERVYVKRLGILREILNIAGYLLAPINRAALARQAAIEQHVDMVIALLSSGLIPVENREDIVQRFNGQNQLRVFQACRIEEPQVERGRVLPHHFDPGDSSDDEMGYIG
jgi:hypothetical protein